MVGDKMINKLAFRLTVISIIVSSKCAMEIIKKVNRDHLKYAYGQQLDGDMILTKRQTDLLYGNRTKRYAIKNESRKWKDGVIPYEISSHFSEGAINMIKGAVKEWNDKTCIQFSEGCRDVSHCLYIMETLGCWSYVGKQKEPMQMLGLGKYCMTHKDILHELGHAIGFYHEHSRADRDKYITILWDNVQYGQKTQFRKTSLDVADYFGVGYDYFSIMHYGPYYFSRNNEKTMHTNGGKYDNVIGRGEHLSPSDITLVNRMYTCAEPPSTTTRKPPVTETTIGSTTEPLWCYNLSGDICNFKATAGECASKHYYMLIYCKKSCNFCHRCFDYSSKCSEKIAECGSVFTSRNCRKTCNLCTEPCEDRGKIVEHIRRFARHIEMLFLNGAQKLADIVNKVNCEFLYSIV